MTKFSTLIDPDIIKISECPAVSTLTGLELMPIIQGGGNKKVTAFDIKKYIHQDLYFVEEYGAVGDGNTDDSSAVMAAINAALAAQGGIIFFAAKRYRINDQVLIPTINDGTGAPVQKSLVFQGCGKRAHGRGGGIAIVDVGGTVLDLRYTGGGQNYSKIASIGFGYFEMCGLTLTDNGTSSNPFFKSTNTTVNLHDISFYGNPTKSTTTCDQDAIILGGDNLPISGDFDTTQNGPFQGYGTSLNNIYFDRIRTGVRLGAYANQISINNLTFWGYCGGVNASAIEIDPGVNVAQGIMGLNLTNVLVEAGTYIHCITAKHLDRSQINNVAAYDYSGNVNWLSAIHLNSCHNLFINSGFWSISGGSDVYVTVESGVIADQATVIQPGNGVNHPGSIYNSIMRAKVGMECRGSGGGTEMSLAFTRENDVTGGPQGGFSNYGRTWLINDTGGNMLIDTGSGGSFMDIRAYVLRLLGQTNVQSGIELMSGTTYKGAIKCGAGATGSRPSAVSCGVAAMWYDKTIHKPIWSDGTVWRDAAGGDMS